MQREYFTVQKENDDDDWRKKRVTTLRAQSGQGGNKTTRNPFPDELYSLWHRLTNFVEIIDNLIAKYPRSQMLSAGF